MLDLSSKNCILITIGRYSFNYVSSVKIVSDWRKFTDTCVITLPKKLRFPNSRQLIQEAFQTGMAVRVEAGYNGRRNLLFEGYIAKSPSPKIPFEIYCEDEMWQLKRKFFSKSFPRGHLSDIIKVIAPGYDTDILDTETGAFHVEDSPSAVEILRKIEEIYGLKSFFRGKKLVVGKPYAGKTVLNTGPDFHLQKNVIENKLEYRFANEIKLIVHAESFIGNKKIHVEIGDIKDPNAEKHTLHMYGVGMEALKQRAQVELEKFKVDGYYGHITCFGVPLARHGMLAYIIDEQYERRADHHFIDAVETTLDEGGLRQKIQFGQKGKKS